VRSVTTVKRDVLSGRGVSINLDEMLICLAMSAAIDANAKKALSVLPLLKGCEMHLSHIPSSGDSAGLRKIGLYVTSDPKYPTTNVYNPV
jgi:uncharacterized protein (UPF0371 family)